MVGPWVFYQEIGVVVDDVATISWNKGLDEAEITGVKSAFFRTVPSRDVMIIDSADKIFSTNNDMIISSLPIVSDVNTAEIEIGYGPVVDSTSGWTRLFSATTIAGQTLDIPRRIFMPKGNFITLNKVSGTGNLHFTGSISISQTITLDSELNNDMEGNSP